MYYKTPQPGTHPICLVLFVLANMQTGVTKLRISKQSEHSTKSFTAKHDIMKKINTARFLTDSKQWPKYTSRPVCFRLAF